MKIVADHPAKIILVEDNTGEQHLINKKYLDVLSQLDDMITDSIDDFSVHEPLVNMWHIILEKAKTYED